MIFNRDKGKVLSKNHRLCMSIFSKSAGLMFRKSPKALVFAFSREKIVPLHMVFVFFPVDVLFLDKKKRVVEIKKSLKPFTFYTPGKKALYVVELPEGAVNKTGTSLGDRIKF